MAEEAFHHWITMDVYESYTEQNIGEIGLAIEKVARFFASSNVSGGLKARDYRA